MIAIDGADEHMGLVHRLGEVDPKKVEIGMRVQAVWKPAKEREGGVTDIKYFKPLPKGKDKPANPVPIKPVEIDAASAKSFPGKIPLTYRYTAGMAGSRFYEDVAKGKITGTWSEEQEALLVPPATFDEDTMEPLDPNDDARTVDPASGYIRAFTVVCEDRRGHVLDEPAIIVQVGFHGAVGSVFGRLEVKADQEFGEDHRWRS
ncbi:MAG: hypothetical protein M5R36_21275 [Deltaproteobacteria bacterium]|nr:hypothetical protein [Deltaproteobacteria bacterium]